MALHQSEEAKGNIPVPYPSCAGVVVAHQFNFTVPTSIAEGDIIELGCIPPTCRLVDALFVSDDLDSDASPAVVWDIGIMSGAWRANDGSSTSGDELFDGITTSQAGGAVRMSEKEGLRDAATAAARAVGAKLVTDADVAVEGVISLTLFYVAD